MTQRKTLWLLIVLGATIQRVLLTDNEEKDDEKEIDNSPATTKLPQ